MKKNFNYNKYLYIIFVILVGLDSITRINDNRGLLYVFLPAYIVMVLSDFSRMTPFHKTTKSYYLSLMFSMVLSTILTYTVGGNLSIFIYVLLYELIIFTEGKLSRILTVTQIINLITSIVLTKISIRELLSIEFWSENFLELILAYIGIGSYILAMFGYKILRKEKNQVERLNNQLEISNQKLIEQAKEIEELTIAKERNRLAGEIHDNLGHGLIALNMNLDVIGKVIDKDIDKAKELIVKSQKLTKENMDSLRKAVYALKEKKDFTLKSSIIDIIENIQASGNIKIDFKIDEEIEKMLPQYKDMFYLTIKETLTNSIKHGKSTEIKIDLDITDNKINLIVVDNGLGCDGIVKGNGLSYIENRITAIGGSVNYKTNKEEGFTTEIQIQIKAS